MSFRRIIDQLTEYEKRVPPLTSRPTHPLVSYQSTSIMILSFLTMKQLTGKSAQSCLMFWPDVLPAIYLQLPNLEIASATLVIMLL